MTPDAPPPSSRLLRAAAAERAELDRHRARLLAAREELRAELARIDAGLADVDERRRLLDRIAPDVPSVSAANAPQETIPLREELKAAVEPGIVLRGPAIRETAVRVLLDRPDIEAIHYRDWFELVTGDGYTIAGKDPLAVFLTQISRSPVVHRSTQAGVYELERDATVRLRDQLDRLHEQLRALSAATVATHDLADVRAKRQELTLEIGQVEKALEEATRLFDRQAADLAAVG
jgi:hypothetical protein